jgi:23S rRNA pseudouridine2457 synthase
MIIAFNKPFRVLSQFTSEGSRHRTLAEFGFPKGVYPIGRLDAESEGLLLLSDEPELNALLLDPNNAHIRVYWSQVERVPNATALKQLGAGVVIGAHRTLPCRAYILDPQPENIPPRVPSIRFRKNVPDIWMALELVEGKNHQVRRMTAAVNHPTLRLIRVRIGAFALGDLPPGHKRILSDMERQLLFKQSP